MALQRILRLLDVEETDHVWLKDHATGKLIENNPYYFEKNALYDNNDAISDEVLGKLIRGEIVVAQKTIRKLEPYQEYFFINEHGETKKKKYCGSLIDAFNIMTGNVFENKEAVTREDRDRIRSILSMIFTENHSLFRYEIQDAHAVAESILAVTDKEKDKHSIVEEDKKNLKGVLKSIAKQ